MQSNVNIRNNSGDNLPPRNPIERSVPDNSVRPSRKDSKTPWVILIIVVLAFLAVIGYLFRDKLMGSGGDDDQKVSGYQAVFLTNGQVYFGKMSNPDSQYITLKDIFYLQVNQQQDLQSGATQQAPQEQPQLSLVKLGNELHGPVDSMQINRDQVLFFEDLRADGKVVDAINQYKANPNAGNQAPASTQNQQPAQGTGVQTAPNIKK
jgi:hypothetical protein